MTSWIIFTIINQIIALTLVKLFLYKGDVSANEAKQDANSWHAAVDNMSKMESRIEQLVSRDVKNQEQVWQLQDLNRELQEKTMRLTKELLAAKHDPEPHGGYGGDDDPDDDPYHGTR